MDATRDYRFVNITPQPWTLVGDLIISVTGGEDTVICRLEPENRRWQNNALLICAAPELLQALRRAASALEEAGKSLTRDSEADILASGALGIAYRLVRQVEAGDDTIGNEGA